MAGMENDLHRVKGIGAKWTAALEKIGVDSVKELSNRNADSLAQMVKERKGARVLFPPNGPKTGSPTRSGWRATPNPVRADVPRGNTSAGPRSRSSTSLRPRLIGEPRRVRTSLLVARGASHPPKRAGAGAGAGGRVQATGR